MELGRDEPDAPLDAIISSQKPNQCCTLIYTSGTTGLSKGVMLSHDNVSYTSVGCVFTSEDAEESCLGFCVIPAYGLGDTGTSVQ